MQTPNFNSDINTLQKYPKNTDKYVFNWLITGCILIGLMLIIGGITRLTQSGLSMVSWDPIMGAIPPLSQEEWEVSFEMYKQSPEFHHYNSDFTLSEYKSIFFWEYIHRLLGRIIGLVFLFPCIYFWWKGFFHSHLKKAVAIIFIMGAFQGLLGWLMVLSGLKDIPHVSHIRLAAHFMMAIILMLYIFWSALRIKYPTIIQTNKFIVKTYFLLGLLFLQAIYGAFVAGLKAGLMYNTFPKMGDRWFPSELSFVFEREGWMSLFNSGGWVQLIHRVLAFIILFYYGLIYLKAKKLKLNLQQQLSLQLVGMLLFLQISLGIITLIYAVPITLGILHQAVAVVLLLATTYLIFNFRHKTQIDD